jgi:hypothetical protein
MKLMIQINNIFGILYTFRIGNGIHDFNLNRMELKDILIFVFVTIALVFSIYRKFVQKKNSGEKSQGGLRDFHSKDQPGSSDDYEPYMKK